MFNIQELLVKLGGLLALVLAAVGYVSNEKRKARKDERHKVEMENVNQTLENVEVANEVEQDVSNASDESIRDSLRDEWSEEN